jgi:DNA recombination protein RmuC
MINYLLVALLALALGTVLGILLLRARESALRSRLAALETEVSGRTGELRDARGQLEALNSDKQRAEQEVAVLNERLRQERNGAAEKLDLLTKASQELQNAFHRLAADALASNNQSFLQLAKTSLESFHKQAEGGLAARELAIAGLVKPIEQSLKSVEEQVKTLETQRVDAYSTLRQQIVSLSGTQEQLKSETAKLVQALRAPHVRGRWGEMQLRRAVEMAGMLDHCDFVEQSSVATDSGRLRPDMIIRLPGGKQIVVDSKAPLQAYLNALEATDEEARRTQMLAHARQIRDHMASLSSKRYWEQFECSPDFVVMFLPGEVFFSAALEHAPDLIEAGVEEKVIPASPTTLIALLRAVHFGWRQEILAENANKISELGKRLYDSLCTMAGHLEKLGANLDRSVKAYNETIGSLERNVLVGGRRFRELGVASTGEIAEAKQIGNLPRVLQSADWKQPSSSAEEEPEEIIKA